MDNQRIRNKHISPMELKRRLDHGERFQFIDVRSPREFEEGHLPGAVNMPLEQLESRVSDLHPHDPAVLVCHSGRRAGICRDLLSQHRDDLVVLEGGTAGWVRQGLPVVQTARTRLALMRQVQLVVGALALTGALLGYFVDRAWNFVPMFIGAGLLVAGSTGFCGMASLLALMPWNRSGRVACSQ